MNICVVMGAGASVAEAATFRPRLDKEHPPLDTNFFSKVRQLGAVRLRATLSEYADRARLGDPFGTPEPRMEEVFGDLYFEVVESTGRAQEEALEAYRALLRLYSGVLARTTNWLAGRLGVIGRFLRVILRIDGLETLNIVTFNHDLVIENALADLPYHRRWCVDRGYGSMVLRSTPTDRATSRLPQHSRDCDHSLPVHLLKLHGSLNWQVETRSHDPSLSDLFPSPASRPRIDCITDRVISTQLSRTRGTRRWRLWPQIAPPIYHKQEIVAARFGALWADAAKALEEASSIVMIGYSLPPADVHSGNLIKRAVRRNEDLKELIVVNPDASVASRIADQTDVDRVEWYRNLDHFVSLIGSA